MQRSEIRKYGDDASGEKIFRLFHRLRFCVLYLFKGCELRNSKLKKVPGFLISPPITAADSDPVSVQPRRQQWPPAAIPPAAVQPQAHCWDPP